MSRIRSHKFSSPREFSGAERDLTSSRKRLTWVMLACVGISSVLMGRAAWLQLGPNPRLEAMARRQFQSKVLIRPRRGLITDRNGEPLSANADVASLAAHPGKIRNRGTMASLLAKVLEIPRARIYQRLGEKREFIWIKRHLTEGDMNRLKHFKIIDGDGDLVSGLWLVQESRRVHPHKELASHVLGDVNIDSDGLEGVELWMNDKLRGKVVSVSAIRDALGRPAFIDAAAARRMQEAKDGESVALTLDASLQFAVEEELRASVTKHGARAGNVIVMNAVNGEILAMANQPAWNPENTNAPAEVRRNRTLTDGFEPGSTLKAILLATALSKGMHLTDRLHGELGSFTVQGKRISEAEAHEKFEWISLKRMIQVSSNVVAAKLALKVGADSYLNSLKAFGFGAKTGTGFPGEISGRLPARKDWQPLTLANIGFGQGLLATPIQVTRAYATLLNGGWLVQPTFFKSGVGNPPIAPKRIISEKVAADVMSALATVTEEGGTGTKAALAGYRVAGKTGTAQKVDTATGRYSRTQFVSSFVGFATGVDPKIVIFTAIDDPRGVYYASETAAPLFREVLNAVANRFGLPTQGITVPAKVLARARPIGDAPTMDARVEPAPEPRPSAAPVAVADHIAVTQAHPVPLRWQGTTATGGFLWKMPPLRGLTPREAIQVLSGHHFSLEVHGSGVVATQSPESGRLLADGDTVRLTLVEP